MLKPTMGRAMDLRLRGHIGSSIVALVLCHGALPVLAQEVAVIGHVEVAKTSTRKQSSGVAKLEGASDAAVWLTELEDGSRRAATKPRTLQLIQRNKSFEPHILVVEVGSVVQFPNQDPFFHNVFSLFNGKRFDLGLYEAGTSNSARFDRPGISYLFCNIHPEMSAVVIAVPTPYFGVSDGAGKLTIPNVPSGRYRVHVWYERSSPEDLEKLLREVVISESARSLEPIRVVDSVAPNLAHKNKYGKDYVPPSNPAYGRP
jgi:plastocyanin